MNNFDSLGLSAPLLQRLEQLGFNHPTPIQEKAIPILLDEEATDFIGLAQTGTGKTAAFGLPLIELMDGQSKHTQALILAPTRELGKQTAKQLLDLSDGAKELNIEVVYGGASIVNQIKALKKPTQIVVATPGRLLDLIGRKSIRLEQVRYVILDEADEMLNMGFKEDIDQILSFIEVPHKTWLFSATMPNEIRKIIKKYMHAPREVSVNKEQKTNLDITHQYVVTKTSDKLSAIQRFLDLDAAMRGILFCRTKRETQEITDELIKRGYEVEALHGDLSQGQRDAAMRRFHAKNMQLLIATDVAARGIDVSELSHVFHHKLPDQLEAYTHRSGRTGRAGNKGLSIAFINSNETRRIKELERKLKLKFEHVQVPSGEALMKNRIEQWMKQLLRMPIEEGAEEIVEELSGHFMPLSKEMLLQKLLSVELRQIKDKESKDLNVSLSKAAAKEKEHFEDTKGPHRYFINIGRKDGLSKEGLHQLLVDVSGSRKKNFDRIVLLDKHAFFDLDQSESEGFAEKFDGLELENGHAIRVNREGARKSQKRSEGRRRNRGGGRPQKGRKGRSGYGKRKKDR